MSKYDSIGINCLKATISFSPIVAYCPPPVETKTVLDEEVQDCPQTRAANVFNEFCEVS